MSFNERAQPSETLDSKDIREVKDFKYLGTLVDTTEKDVKIRRVLA